MSSSRRKSFRQYLAEENPELVQEGLFSKGFAIAQQVRFNSTRTTLKSVLSRARSELTSAIRAEDVPDKLNSLAKALIALNDALEVHAALLGNVMNVTVVDAVLSEDIEASLKKFLASQR